MKGRIPESVIEEIHQRINIVDVVSSYVNLTYKGGRWWGLCPFHSEKTPSFTVNQENNLYYCFGCQKGGNAINFLMETESLSFIEAVRRLAEKAGIEISYTESDRSRINTKKVLEELYFKVSVTFHWLLLNHPGAAEAREYLKLRGISEDTRDAFQLGWAPADGEWLYDFLVNKKYSPEFLATSGLFSRKSSHWAFFIDRLMFPIMPSADRVIAFSGRSFGEKVPKYKNSSDTPLFKKSNHLYGLGQAMKSIRLSRQVYLCEGNIDVLACRQSGLGETVAPLGTSFTEEQARILKRLADSVVIIFDGDDAGRKGTMRAAILAEQHGLSVKAVSLPPGSDPAELMVQKGENFLQKMLIEPVNVFDYMLDCQTSSKPVISGEVQEKILKELIPYLQAVESEVRRESYLLQLAEAVNSSPPAVIKEYNNLKRGDKRLSITRKERHLDIQTSGDELYLMTAVAVKTEFFPALRTMLAPEVFRDKRALAIYRVMDELTTAGKMLRTDMVAEQLENPQLVSFILEKAVTEEFMEKAEQTINDKINLLRIRTLTEENRELIKKLAHGSIEQQTKLITRIKDIDQEIMSIRQDNHD
ncbi:MAG: DNA primase [Spirochaeta sp. LUC14_002_19_P3]|nr:MAG: DNA primase [Spirochaeta sp. LUC14_002_19_P3]